MKLVSRGANCHELVYPNGNSVLFSYETPVAVSFSLPIGKLVPGVYRTAGKFSKTTSKHINAWTNTTRLLDQGELESVAAIVGQDW